MAKTVSIKLEGDLYTWINGMVGGQRGETLEEVVNSILETGRGRMKALATYRKGTKKTKKAAKRPARRAAPASKSKTAKKRVKPAKATPAPVASPSSPA